MYKVMPSELDSTLQISVELLVSSLVVSLRCNYHEFPVILT